MTTARHKSRHLQLRSASELLFSFEFAGGSAAALVCCVSGGRGREASSEFEFGVRAAVAPVGAEAHVEAESGVDVLLVEAEVKAEAEVVGAEAIGATSHAEREYE